MKLLDGQGQDHYVMHNWQSIMHKIKQALGKVLGQEIIVCFTGNGESLAGLQQLVMGGGGGPYWCLFIYK